MPITAQIDRRGGLEKIRLVDVPVQRPEADEVQVRMRAAGINRAELFYVAGHYLVEPQIPNASLGAEGAGEIISVGSSGSEFAEGDRVCVLPMMD